MSTEHPYSPLGYPFVNLPRPGRPVTALTVRDTVYPLLRGASALLIAVEVSLRTADLDNERASWALALIEGQVTSALHLLQRWEETQETTKQAPATRTESTTKRSTIPGGSDV